jgi:hypothetical protein
MELDNSDGRWPVVADRKSPSAPMSLDVIGVLRFDVIAFLGGLCLQSR